MVCRVHLVYRVAEMSEDSKKRPEALCTVCIPVQLYTTYEFSTLSTYLPIYVSIHPSIYLSFYLSIYLHALNTRKPSSIPWAGLGVTSLAVRKGPRADARHGTVRLAAGAGSEDSP